MGRVYYQYSNRRRKIALINLSHCFKQMSESEKEAIVKASFENVGCGFIEMICAWWMPKWRLLRIPFKLEIPNGSLTDRDKGLMLCGAHFTSMEMVGCQFGLRFGKLHLVYQKHKDPVINAIMIKGRKRYAKGLIDRKDMRGMIRVMRQGDFLWYAPDQDLGRRVSVFVPFFGVQTATVKAMGTLLKAGRADCFFSFFHRRSNAYELTLYSQQGLPTGNDINDALIYNKALEQKILAHPEQYLWMHRRFKTRPEGEGGFYDR